MVIAVCSYTVVNKLAWLPVIITAPLMSAQFETPRTGELLKHNVSYGEKVAFDQQPSPAGMDPYYRQPSMCSNELNLITFSYVAIYNVLSH